MTNGGLSRFITFFRRPEIPGECFGFIFVASDTIVVAVAQTVLCRSKTHLRGFAVVFNGDRMAFFDDETVE